MRHKILIRALAWVLALTLTLGCAFAYTQATATIYVDTVANGGLAINGGTTDTLTPFAGCAASCTTTGASWTSSAGGTGTAASAWALGATSFNVVACTNVQVNGGVWDTTLTSQGMIGVAASCTGAGPFVLTLTGPAVHSSSAGGTGASDGLAFGTPITLNGSPDFHTLPGCTLLSGVTYGCDGSQKIGLGTATNGSMRQFMISGFTSCSGSGTCILGVGGNGVGYNPACTTCSGSTATWAIGGRITFPFNNQTGILPGDTLILNNSINCGAATCAANLLGDLTTGPVIMRVASGAVTLSNTGNFAVLSISGPTVVRGPITLSNSGATTVAELTMIGSNGAIDNITFNSPSGTGACVNITQGNINVINSNFLACGGDAINDTSTNGFIVGNNITGAIIGNGINLTLAANNVYYVAGNIIDGVWKSGYINIRINFIWHNSKQHGSRKPEGRHCIWIEQRQCSWVV